MLLFFALQDIMDEGAFFFSFLKFYLTFFVSLITFLIFYESFMMSGI